ncbi:cytochrome b [Solilutibacter silvestris]|uniref:Cytochrome B561 n=1 Tax=Solilutibacter silvestris TaxID=1645665 RepID=A0A2K1PXC0_9GAMM|nr:cytochrome b [Lysobacter silvestris]PNS07438.1 Cytochrome B561 [Lysobacter silvestris]
MALENTSDQWGGVSKTLHWLIVILIIVMGWLGLTMVDLPNSPHKIATYALHKSIGLTIFALVIARLAWRLYAGAPAEVAGTPRWQHTLATLMHWALYALLLVTPLSGWIVNSAAGFPLQWFGMINLPALVARDHDLHERMANVHQYLFWTMVVLAVLHAGAALYHHFIQRDATLARMLPRGWLRANDQGDT